MSEIVVKELTVYPMKACQGASLDRVEVTQRGVVGDRGFALWEEGGKLVDQKDTPQTAALSVRWDEGQGELALSHPSQGEYAHTVREEGAVRSATWVFDQFDTWDQGDDVAEWLSEALAKRVRLVTAKEAWKKNIPLDQFAAIHGQPTERFYAASPVSLSSTASLEDLNAKLEHPVPMDRFRMNLVVEGLEPWAEDDVVAISSDEVSLRRVTHCERCVITATDQATGERPESDLLQGLRKHRYREEGRFGSGLLFGAYMDVVRPGTLQIGDRLEVEW